MRNLKSILCLLFLVYFVIPIFDCTIFFIGDKDTALAGNNEDHDNSLTFIWTVPQEGKNLGIVYFGFDDYWPQGGLNTAGLFYDASATRPNPVTLCKGKPEFKGNLIDHIMKTCSEVEEVIARLEKYDYSNRLLKSQFLFADKSGDWVIIEGDKVIRKNKHFAVITNFYQSRFSNNKFPCPRFKKARAALQKPDKINLELCKNILADTAVTFTQYSTVSDLKAGNIYIYHYHNYSQRIQVNVAQFLKKGKIRVPINSLFPPNNHFLKEKQQCKWGKKNGTFKINHLNGQLKHIITYVDNQIDGKTTWWYKDGQKEREYCFEKGLRSGEWTWWYKNGKKKAVRNFKENLLHGMETSFETDGSLKSKFLYRDGKKIKQFKTED